MDINLIIVAMQEELDGILSQIKEYEIEKNKYTTLYKFKIKEETYYLTLGKIGKVASAFFIGYLASIYNIKRIFNVGTSGSLKDNVKIGDVIIADKISYYDVDVTSFNYELNQVPSCPKFFVPDKNYLLNKIENKYDFKIHQGLIVSGDTFINKKNVNNIEKSLLKEALCSEMESASVAQCAYILDIPFIIIRSISDVVTEDENALKHDINLQEVSLHAGRVLLDILTK